MGCKIDFLHKKVTWENKCCPKKLELWFIVLGVVTQNYEKGAAKAAPFVLFFICRTTVIKNHLTNVKASLGIKCCFIAVGVHRIVGIGNEFAAALPPDQRSKLPGIPLSPASSHIRLLSLAAKF